MLRSYTLKTHVTDRALLQGRCVVFLQLATAGSQTTLPLACTSFTATATQSRGNHQTTALHCNICVCIPRSQRPSQISSSHPAPRTHVEPAAVSCRLQQPTNRIRGTRQPLRNRALAKRLLRGMRQL